MECRVNGCTKVQVYKTLELCRSCYDRRRSLGDENKPRVYTRGFSMPEKMAHYREVPDDPDACFGWSSRINEGGYAQIWEGGRKGSFRSAHRVAYELEHGEIPEGAHVDHTCHNLDMTCQGGPSCLHRRCTNPRHLRAGTRQENMSAARMSERPGYRERNRNAAKTYCKWGHEFTDENTWTSKEGARYCRACLARRAGEARERKKTATPVPDTYVSKESPAGEVDR